MPHRTPRGGLAAPGVRFRRQRTALLALPFQFLDKRRTDRKPRRHLRGGLAVFTGGYEPAPVHPSNRLSPSPVLRAQSLIGPRSRSSVTFRQIRKRFNGGNEAEDADAKLGHISLIWPGLSIGDGQFNLFSRLIDLISQFLAWLEMRNEFRGQFDSASSFRIAPDPRWTVMQ